MTGITTAINNLINSILSVFRDIFAGIFSVFQSIFALFVTLVQQVTGLAEDTASFVLRNFLVLAVLGGAFYAWVTVQQRRGTSVAGKKKSA